MTSSPNGRIRGINKTEGTHFKVVWPGSIYAVDSWTILKGSPNKDAAMDFIAFASLPEHMSKLPQYLGIGLPSKAAAAMVPADLGADLPTLPANMADAIAIDTEFWSDNIEDLTKRFNAWLGQ